MNLNINVVTVASSYTYIHTHPQSCIIATTNEITGNETVEVHKCWNGLMMVWWNNSFCYSEVD